MNPTSLFRVCARLLLVCPWMLAARPVQVTLWISGGTHGILAGGRNAPGSLGVVAHLRESSHPGFWLDVGGNGDFPLFPPLRLPDAVVPGGEVLRAGGVSLLQNPEIPWTALNVAGLPQYPGFEVPFLSTRLLETPDGARLRVIGLLAGDTPLRVPPQELRPLRVTRPSESLRDALPGLRAGPTEFLLLVLPEGENPGEWSRAFPDIPLFVEPAAAPAAVIPLDAGRRLRVRPAPHGRALIRVTMVWDTVSRTFGNPDAEVVWVRSPDLSRVLLPDALTARVRPLPNAPDPTAWSGARGEERLTTRLMEKSNTVAVLWPAHRRSDVEISASPDSWRAALAPVDDVWYRITLDAETARALVARPVPGAAWVGRVSGGGAPSLLVPAEFAAGSGGDARHLRRVVDNPETQVERMPFSTRDLLPLEAGDRP